MCNRNLSGGKTSAQTSEGPARRSRSPGQRKGSRGKFATAINCMDGRAQLPIINWLMENYAVDYVDMITEPGPDGILAKGSAAAQDSIKARVLISIDKHGSDTIVVAGHHDCAGNPVTRMEHEKHIHQSIAKVQSWKLPVKRILGVWVNNNWEVEIIGSLDSE